MNWPPPTHTPLIIIVIFFFIINKPGPPRTQTHTHTHITSIHPNAQVALLEAARLKLSYSHPGNMAQALCAMQAWGRPPDPHWLTSLWSALSKPQLLLMPPTQHGLVQLRTELARHGLVFPPVVLGSLMHWCARNLKVRGGRRGGPACTAVCSV